MIHVCQIKQFSFNINLIKRVNHYQNIEIIFLNGLLQNGIKYDEIWIF